MVTLVIVGMASLAISLGVGLGWLLFLDEVRNKKAEQAELRLHLLLQKMDAAIAGYQRRDASRWAPSFWPTSPESSLKDLLHVMERQKQELKTLRSEHRRTLAALLDEKRRK